MRSIQRCARAACLRASASVSALALSCAVALAPECARAEVPPVGVGLPLQFEAGLWQGDLWGGGVPGFRWRQPGFALELSLPLWVRLADLSPASPRSGDPCAWLRCERLGIGAATESFLGGGPATPALLGEALVVLSRSLTLLRMGSERGGGMLHAGPMVASLGHGTLVERVMNSPDPDAPRSGLHARLGASSAPISLEAFAADATSPLSLVGARLTWRPFAPGHVQSGGGAAESIASRLALSGELALDGESWLDSRAPPAVAALAGELSWSLLSPEDALHIDPYCALGALAGLRADDGGKPGLGAGGQCGVRVDMRGEVVALRVEGAGGLAGPGYRGAYFSTLYLVERQLSWAPLGGAEVPLAERAAPGGYQGRLGVELRIGSDIHGGFRYARDAVPGSGTLEAFAAGAFASMHLAGRCVLRRAEGTPTAWLPPRAEATLCVLESSVVLVGPLSAYLRYWRLPRIHEGRRILHDDVMAGLSLDWELRPGSAAAPGP